MATTTGEVAVVEAAVAAEAVMAAAAAAAACQGLHFFGLCPCVRGVVLLCDDVCFVMLCALKASVYLSKRINSSLLTKIFNGIR